MASALLTKTVVAAMQLHASVPSLPAVAVRHRHIDVAVRIGWTIATVLAVESLICGAALAPTVYLWLEMTAATNDQPTARLLLFSLAVVPSYILFSLTLMAISPLVIRALGWRTPSNLQTRVADMDWPLLRWVRYMVAAHLVRAIAGPLFRGSPVWTAYLRLAGARLGRRVYINSLSVTDYNLLEFGDDVVIGDGVHLSGHTVEGGLLKTAPVRLGRQVTIGVGTVVGIGVTAGDGCQVGALSLVPKHAQLAARATYVGIPVQPIDVGRDD